MSTSDIVWIIGLPFLICFGPIILMLILNKRALEKEKEMLEEIKSKAFMTMKKANIDYDIKFLYNFDLICIDTKNEKIYISDTEKLYDYADIINIDIINDNDNVSISRTNGVNQKKVSFTKAIVGNALFGPAGAIIGGTSGKIKINETTITQNQAICRRLDIIFTFKDERVKIPFLYKPADINSPMYEKAKIKFDELSKILQTITKAEEYKQNITYANKEDIKGKLRDLKDMLNEGLITEEEYEQKRNDFLTRM